MKDMENNLKVALLLDPCSNFPQIAWTKNKTKIAR